MIIYEYRIENKRKKLLLLPNKLVFVEALQKVPSHECLHPLGLGTQQTMEQALPT